MALGLGTACGAFAATYDVTSGGDTGGATQLRNIIENVAQANDVVNFGAAAYPSIVLGSWLTIGQDPIELRLDQGADLTISGSLLLINGRTTVNTVGVTDRVFLSASTFGSGGLTKEGAGTLVFDAGVNLVGDTILRAGSLTTRSSASGARLTIENDGRFNIEAQRSTVSSIASASSASTLSVGGELELAGSDPTTFDGRIIGSGSISMSSDGDWTLTGNNNGFTGDFFLTSSKLTVAGGQAINDSSRVDLFNMATLRLLSDETIGSITTRGREGDVDLGSHVLTVGGDGRECQIEGRISGTGAIVKVGAGGMSVLDLFGEFAGLMVVDGGTLRYAGRMSRASFVVNGNGTLNVDLPLTISSLSGSGRVLLGDATTLTSGGGNGDDTFSGVISGSGGFTKVGTGTTTFTGSNTYDGVTAVNEGTFVNDGALAGALEVAEGARYRGSGSVASATFRGSVAPGNSIGTTVITGDASFDASSTYEVEVNADGRSDRIAVGGMATVNNANVRVVPEPGAFAFRSRYTILSAGTLIGSFGSVISLDALFRAAVSSEGNSVILSLERALSFVPSGRTLNESNVATVLDAQILASEVAPGSDLETVLNQAGAITPATQSAFLGQLTPEVQAQSTSALLLSNQIFQQTVLLRQAALRSRRESEREYARRQALKAQPQTSAVPGSKVAALTSTATGSGSVTAGETFGRGKHANPATQEYEWEAWALGFDQQGKLDADGNATGARFDSDGFNLGVSRQVDENWLLGFNIGSADTNVRRDLSLDRVDSQGTNYGLYASYDLDRLAIDFQLGMVQNDLTSRRAIAQGAINRIASGSYDGEELYGLAEASYLLSERNGFQIRPTFSLASRNLEQDAFTETGAGALNLAVRKRETDSFQSGLGVRLSKRFFGHRSGWWEPELKVRWQHEFSDVDRLVTSNFVGTTRTFQTAGRLIDEDVLQTRVGVTGRTESGIELNASYFREDAGGQGLDGIVGQATYSF